MMFKSRSIATKLLLTSSISAVILVVAIVAFVKLALLPQLTNKALENQTSALAHLLKVTLGSADQWNEESLSREDVLDAYSNDGKSVVTVFLLKDGQFVRMATTLKKDDGSRAIGTVLAPESDAAKSLLLGKEYSGYITVYDRLHMTTYLPVSFDNGKRGAVVVAVDYSAADPTLALARQLDYVVVAVGAASIILLGIGLLFSIRVEQAHRETEDIFRTTQEGLFLLDPGLRMGSQTSAAASRVLGFEAKSGDNFLELLKPLVTPKTFDTAKEYTELLLRHDIKEKLVASLNPLDCVEICLARPGGGEETRFLQIRFNRVLRAGKVTHLLVTVNDITKQVKLERELKESERRVQDQMGMMVFILQADPQLLQDFLNSATNGLNQINEDLRTSNPVSGISNVQIDAMLRCVHQLKGDAAALQLEAIAKSLHAFESLLQGARGQKQNKGEDLLPITVRVKALYAEIGAVQEVIVRIGQVRGVVSVEPPRPARGAGNGEQQALVRQWQVFAQQLAVRHEKRIELSYQGLDLQNLAPPLREALNSVMNQFIRNALVHGVEGPAERKQRGKSEVAHLSVYVSDQGDGAVELSFRDDGRGIDPESIRASLIRSGRFEPETAKNLSVRQLTMAIFEPGFSTREVADEDAGRGVGLDAAKALILRMGGRIRIGSTRGEYCHFRVQWPLVVAAPTMETKNEPVREAA